MRLSGLSGLGVMAIACHIVVACADSEDRWNGDGSTAGEGGEPSRGGTSSAGSRNDAGDAGAMMAAGADMGGSGPGVGGGPAMGGTGVGGADDAMGGMGGTDDAMGGMGQAGMGQAGMGEAGTSSLPECATAADCNDDQLCTDDACTDGQCVHTNNTAACDDLSACTPGQDRCSGGVCSGTRDINACPACNVPNNIIKNCDFSAGLTNWAESFAFQGATATQAVVNGRNVIAISAGGDGIYSVQPRQEPLTMKRGMRYKLRIVAGSSVERDIAMALSQGAEPYKVYSTGDHPTGGFTLHLEEQMKQFEFEFEMVDPDDANVKLEIKMGDDKTVGGDIPSIVYFDDVVVEELKCTGNPSCDDDNPCTADVCDLVAGTCSSTPTTDACADDGDACTKDECLAGECTHTFDDVACNCSTDAQCDDGNVCTDDDCNAGACAITDNTNACNDNDPCTVSDACAGGDCNGSNLCFDCTVGGNILTNCDFASGETGWLAGFFANGDTVPAGTQSVVDGRLVVNITNGGTEPWQVQPRQENLALVAGQEYVVKFNAMATVARTMELSVTQNGGAYASYSNQPPFNLKTDMQLFTFNFTMPDPLPSEPVKLEMKLGGTVPNATLPNSVTLDNMFIGPKP